MAMKIQTPALVLDPTKVPEGLPLEIATFIAMIRETEAGLTLSNLDIPDEIKFHTARTLGKFISGYYKFRVSPKETSVLFTYSLVSFEPLEPVKQFFIKKLEQHGWKGRFTIKEHTGIRSKPFTFCLIVKFDT